MNESVDRSRATCVVGLGAVTPIGLTAAASAAAARAGIAGFSDHPFMIDRIGEPFVVASVPVLDVDLAGEDRLLSMAVPAIQEALEPIGALALENGVPLVIGLPEPRPGCPADLETKLGEKIASECRAAAPTFLPNGHSAGLMALQSACERIRSERSEFVLIGGIDSYMDPDTLEWIEESEQLHNLHNAWGFIPGEGAAFCLLSSEETAKRYHLPVLGRLLGAATATEENRIKTETVCIGKGLTQAVQGVLETETVRGVRVDHTICDLNGEAYRADEFGFMLARTSERFVDTSAFTSPADCWGDVGAASGPLFIALASANSASKGSRADAVTLLWTSSEGGERAAVLFMGEDGAAEAH